MIRPEILAPAGSYESLTAAVAAGADAMYVGGNKFGARAYADNFTEAKMCEAIDYAHQHGKKLYLTVNTLLKDEELKNEMYHYLLPYYRQGLDAVIVQDIGVLSFLHRNFPDLPLHASTQMTITGPDAPCLLKEFGVTRIVPARELSLGEIKRIKESSGLEIETFVHGALCYCYSGQCLLSSMIGGRSGNRGRCAQPCRLPYQLASKQKVVSSEAQKYLLSPKDLCTLSILPDLVGAGIDSFKIEGRMKKPEYVASVVSIYKKYLDLYCENPDAPYEPKREDLLALMELYNRGGFTQGYYEMHNGPSMMSMNRPNHRGILIGIIEKVKGNQIYFTCQEAIHKQDILEIIISEEESVELTSPDEFEKNAVVVLNGKNIRRLKPGQSIYRTKNKMLIDSLQETIQKGAPKEKLSAWISLKKGQPAAITITHEGICAYYEASLVEEAKKQPLTQDKVLEQLHKTGTAAYDFGTIDVKMDSDIFVPVQVLKELRRNGMAAYEKAQIQRFKRKGISETPCYAEEIQDQNCKRAELVVELSDFRYFEVIKNRSTVSGIYLDLSNLPDKTVDTYAKEIHEADKKCYILLPAILREMAREELIQNKNWFQDGTFDGVVIRNLDELAFFMKYGTSDMEWILDSSLYQYNKETERFYQKLLKGKKTIHVLPLELNSHELISLGSKNSELIVYGRTPVMFSAQCLIKNTKGCEKKTTSAVLIDRYKNEFLVHTNCKYCYNTIYNHKPLLLFDQKDAIQKINPVRHRIRFVDESLENATQILDDYDAVLNLEKKTVRLTDYTRGHFKRGVE